MNYSIFALVTDAHGTMVAKLRVDFGLTEAGALALIAAYRMTQPGQVHYWDRCRELSNLVRHFGTTSMSLNYIVEKG